MRSWAKAQVAETNKNTENTRIAEVKVFTKELRFRIYCDAGIPWVTFVAFSSSKVWNWQPFLDLPSNAALCRPYAARYNSDSRANDTADESGEFDGRTISSHIGICDTTR
jgi:hypothetical protein